jgi:hypothetical protein
VSPVRKAEGRGGAETNGGGEGAETVEPGKTEVKDCLLFRPPADI